MVLIYLDYCNYFVLRKLLDLHMSGLASGETKLGTGLILFLVFRPDASR